MVVVTNYFRCCGEKRGEVGKVSNGTLTLDLAILVQHSYEMSWPSNWLFYKLGLSCYLTKVVVTSLSVMSDFTTPVANRWQFIKAFSPNRTW